MLKQTSKQFNSFSSSEPLQLSTPQGPSVTRQTLHASWGHSILLPSQWDAGDAPLMSQVYPKVQISSCILVSLHETSGSNVVNRNVVSHRWEFTGFWIQHNPTQRLDDRLSQLKPICLTAADSIANTYPSADNANQQWMISMAYCNGNLSLCRESPTKAPKSIQTIRRRSHKSVTRKRSVPPDILYRCQGWMLPFCLNNCVVKNSHWYCQIVEQK